MAKTINFTFEGTDYTLEYTRASVAALEKQGFNIGDPLLCGNARRNKHLFCHWGDMA